MRRPGTPPPNETTVLADPRLSSGILVRASLYNAFVLFLPVLTAEADWAFTDDFWSG
jgi:hypothetical protein